VDNEVEEESSMTPGRLKPSPGNFFVASMPEFAAAGDFAGGVFEHDLHLTFCLPPKGPFARSLDFVGRRGRCYVAIGAGVLESGCLLKSC